MTKQQLMVYSEWMRVKRYPVVRLTRLTREEDLWLWSEAEGSGVTLAEVLRRGLQAIRDQRAGGEGLGRRFG